VSTQGFFVFLQSHQQDGITINSSNNMLLNTVFIVLGIILVLWGADRMTEGSVALAERFNVSQLTIGLTIVAMGTSLPEFCVSLVSALKGTPDLAVGNIVGSNIFNALLIVGVAAMVTPINITLTTVRKDIPFALVASVLLMMMCFDGKISRLNGAILLAMFAIFMVITFKTAGQDPQTQNDDKPAKKPMKLWLCVVFIIAGLGALILGSELFVNGATKVATLLGVSQAVIGLTIVAGGTSLPELATSVVAARKGNSGIAIGNVLGSNVFNILFILGVTGVISPMHMQGITMMDLSVMATAMIMLWLFSYTKLTLERWEGAVLTATFLIYLGYLLVPLL